MATVFGTDTANWLTGTGGADLIKGFGGDDTLKGGGGADQLYGGTGIDSAIYADSPSGVGVTLADGIGYGGSAEGDRLFSIENVYGSGYDDEIIGNGGANSLYGLSGNDSLSGGGGADLLDGADGDDMLKGGGGADVLIGGIGTDVADYRGAPGGVFVSLIDNAGHWSDAQGDAFYGIENVWGSMYHADVLIGDNGGNHLKGFGGDDELRGHGGDDLLEGGNGADTMIGGSGNDTYMVRDVTDVIIESGGQGTDTVYTEVSYVLTPGADVEILAYYATSSTYAVDLTGNASGNLITGNNGSNVINGGDGRDTLTGLGGQDSFLFNTPLSEAVNVDRITDFNVADDTIWLDDAIFSSSLGLGNISAGELVIGTAAQDANDRIIYDSSTGALYYDSDGNGGTPQVRFAELSPGLALTYLDFYVV